MLGNHELNDATFTAHAPVNMFFFCCLLKPRFPVYGCPAPANGCTSKASVVMYVHFHCRSRAMNGAVNWKPTCITRTPCSNHISMQQVFAQIENRLRS